MVKVYSDWIYIDNQDPCFKMLMTEAVCIEKSRTQRMGKRIIDIPERTIRLYTLSEDKRIMILPAGLFFLLKKYFVRSDVQNYLNTSEISTVDDLIFSMNDYKNILPGIELRVVQLVAMRKILHYKRCVIQISTGGGKTEIMCGVVKVLNKKTGVTPTTLILEPTVKLVESTINRFDKYEIETSKYSENREIINNTVNISHPTSLCNDLKKNPDLLDNVEILFGDECHHMSSDTFRTPTYSLSNIIYSVGMSASAIDHSRVNSEQISEFNHKELLILGATGRVALNITAGSLIGNKQLSVPVLLVISNLADEPIGKDDITNWHVISKERLESDHRCQLIADTANYFHSVNRKSLILVRTRRWAHKIMQLLDNYNLSDTCRASFGGGVFEKYVDGEFIQDKDDVFSKYESGDCSILIGTSHLYEGVDIPNLDVIILGYGGKGERLQIQGLGRVLRLTKTGKMAWIVDFTDSADVVLSNHNRLRMKRYRELINIPEDKIFYNIEVKEIENIFNNFEK